MGGEQEGWRGAGDKRRGGGLEEAGTDGGPGLGPNCRMQNSYALVFIFL